MKISSPLQYISRRSGCCKTMPVVLMGLLFSTGMKSLYAQSVSLFDAIQMAQRESFLGRAILNNYRSTQWMHTAVRASLYPQLSFSADVPGYNSSIKPIVQPSGNILYQPVNQGYSNASLSLQQVIPLTGGTMFMQSALSRFDVFGSNPRTTWQSSPYVIGFRQPVFRANALKFYYNQESLQHTINQKKFVEDMEDLALTITQKYFECYLAKLQLKNAEYDVQINDSLFVISKGRFEVGKIAENDVLQSELNLLNARNSAEQSRLQLQNAEKELRLLLGLSESASLTLQPPLAAPAFLVDVNTAIHEAINNRSEITALYINELTTRRNLKLAAEKRRPTIDFNFTYGNTNTAPELSGVYKNLLSQNSISFGISSPLFGFGKSHAEYQSARYAYDAQQERIQYERRKFEIDISNKVQQFLQLRTSLLISAKADTIAQKRYEVAKDRYMVGKIDITNFSLAQKEKNESLIAYIRTLENFWTSYYQLRRFTLYDFEKGVKIMYQ